MVTEGPPKPSYFDRHPITRRLTPDQRRGFLVKLFGSWAMVGFGVRGLTVFPKHGVQRPPW